MFKKTQKSSLSSQHVVAATQTQRGSKIPVRLSQVIKFPARNTQVQPKVLQSIHSSSAIRGKPCLIPRPPLLPKRTSPAVAATCSTLSIVGKPVVTRMKSMPALAANRSAKSLSPSAGTDKTSCYEVASRIPRLLPLRKSNQDNSRSVKQSTTTMSASASLGQRAVCPADEQAGSQEIGSAVASPMSGSASLGQCAVCHTDKQTGSQEIGSAVASPVIQLNRLVTIPEVSTSRVKADCDLMLDGKLDLAAGCLNLKAKPALHGKFGVKVKQPMSRIELVNVPNRNTFTELPSLNLCTEPRSSTGINIITQQLHLETPIFREYEPIYHELQRLKLEASGRNDGDLLRDHANAHARDPVSRVLARAHGARARDQDTIALDMKSQLEQILSNLQEVRIDVLRLQQERQRKDECEKELNNKDVEIHKHINKIKELESSHNDAKAKLLTTEIINTGLKDTIEKLSVQKSAQDKELQKSRLSLVCRARELENLRCDMKRRDARSSEIVNEYLQMNREKNNLALSTACLEIELEAVQTSALHLEAQNRELAEKLSDLEKQYCSPGGDKTEDDRSKAGAHLDYPITSQIITEPVNPEDVFVWPPQVEPADGLPVEPVQSCPPLAHCSADVPQDDRSSMMYSDGIMEPQVAQPLTLTEAISRISALEMSVAEKDGQLKDFQHIVEEQRAKGDSLENERENQLMQLQGLRLQSIQDAKQIQVLEEQLQLKQDIIEDTRKDLGASMERNDSLLRQQKVTNETFGRKERGWLAECRRACEQIREIEECMRKKDVREAELIQIRDELLNENKKLKYSLEHLGQRKTLEDSQSTTEQAQKFVESTQISNPAFQRISAGLPDSQVRDCKELQEPDIKAQEVRSYEENSAEMDRKARTTKSSPEKFPVVDNEERDQGPVFYDNGSVVDPRGTPIVDAHTRNRNGESCAPNKSSLPKLLSRDTHSTRHSPDEEDGIDNLRDVVAEKGSSGRMKNLQRKILNSNFNKRKAQANLALTKRKALPPITERSRSPSPDVKQRALERVSGDRLSVHVTEESKPRDHHVANEFILRSD